MGKVSDKKEKKKHKKQKKHGTQKRAKTTRLDWTKLHQSGLDDLGLDLTRRLDQGRLD